MIIINLIDKLIQKSAFPKVISFENELMKMGILRIVLGIIVFIRFAEISQSIEVLNYSPKLEFDSYVLLVLILCFVIGFCTPIVSLLLMFSLFKFDLLFGTFTLGTSILQVTLISFVLVNSGQYYSLDRLLLRRDSMITRPIKFMFKFLGSDNETTITRAYFLTFIIYGIISFGALTFHIRDEFWVEGLTTKALLLNSYLCKHYSLFRIIEDNIPYLLSVVSVLAGVFQSIFQFLMLPLIYFTGGRKFVFFYGLMFFLVSLFFINLSYLPHVEIILWLMIFLPIRRSKRNVEIFYDDHCNLCKRTMRFFKLINFNERFIFSPVSLNMSRITKYDFSEKEVKSFMAGTYKEDLFVGYDLYIKIGLVNPLLFPVVPLLYLGKLTTIGPLIYNFIAERRYKYFGLCEMSFGDEISQKSIPIQVPTYQFVNNFLIKGYSVLVCLYILFRIPIVYSHVKHIPLVTCVRPTVMEVLNYSGFVLPNVFNKTDLSMGNYWMELYRLENDQLFLVPIVGREGERLSYENFDILNFTNHNSDVLYFGTTLRFRRRSLAGPKKIMAEKKFGWNNLLRRIKYDYNISGFQTEKRYLVRIYKNHQSQITLKTVNPKKFEKKLKFENWYLYDNKSMSLISKNDKLLLTKSILP